MTEEEKKDVRRAYNKRYREANRDRLREAEKASREANPEKYKAKQAKWLEKNRDKHNAKRRETGKARRATLEHKEYAREYSAQYRANNKDKILARQAEYRAKNRGERAAEQREYAYINREFINTYRRERMATDIQFKIGCNLRTRLGLAVRKQLRGEKGASAVGTLGCTIPELMNWLESKFEPGMSWDNWSRDGWHIDHDMPLALFDLSDPEQVALACHFTNLKPMWAKDNSSKGARLVL